MEWSKKDNKLLLNGLYVEPNYMYIIIAASAFILNK